MTASIAFVCPRYAEGGTVGGAETLMRELARRAVRAGRRVTFLTTCARDHFTWANELPAGRRAFDGLDVHYFPVDEQRDARLFGRLQQRLGRGGPISEAEEALWVEHSVNSPALYEHLRAEGARYDRILVGPYLFGLTIQAARIHPEKTLLVSCLHDEPFAYLRPVRRMFESVRGCLFNTEPERQLAQRIFGPRGARGAVVGMGLDAFEADPLAFARRRGLSVPYVMYAGRRETAKGTPLLADYLHVFRERTGRDIKLVCTGSGAIEAPYELEPHILDLGFVSEQEKQEAMAGAVAFIHPSRFESLGIVLLESFLARTPALVHAGSEVLQWQCARSGAGLWFRTYPEFEEELALLLDQPALRRRMGEQGRRYVLAEYAWEAVDRRFFAALE